MSEKPEALVLADAFETYALIPPGLQRVAAIPCVVSRTELSQAARLLRSQHAEIERLNAVALQAQNAAIDLTKKNERLREALKLAFTSHGRMLMSDPPQDAWKFNRVDEVIVAALRREET